MLVVVKRGVTPREGALEEWNVCAAFSVCRADDACAAVRRAAIVRGILLSAELFEADDLQSAFREVRQR